ncbi:MAG: response regulator [Planctomycetota bacterium]
MRCAKTGEDGLRQALRWGADIVLTDERAPGVDGPELCKSLRRNEQGEGVYLLVIGSSSSPDRGLQAFAAGADDFVELPCPQEVVGARIQAGVRVCGLQRRVDRDKATMMRQVAELGVLTRKLRATALTDSLTGLPNRRYALKRLENGPGAAHGPQHLARDARRGSFQGVNDNLGTMWATRCSRRSARSSRPRSAPRTRPAASGARSS